MKRLSRRTEAFTDSVIRRALILSTGNTDRVSPIGYLPVYTVMFLDHDGLPSNLTFPKPSLDLPVSPHFKNR